MCFYIETKVSKAIGDKEVGIVKILVFGMSTNICGGIESFLLNMNKFMSGDCIFDYVLLGNSAVFEDEIRKNGGKPIYVTSYRKNPIKYFLELVRILKSNKREYKAAYFNLFSMVHMLPVLLCRLFGYKIILHSHNNNLQQSSKVYRMLHRLNRALFGNLNCLRLTNSDASTEFMFGKGKKATLIYNAVDTEKFMYNPANREKIRKELGITDNIVIGFSGRLSPQKNPLFLIEIFEAVHKRNNNTVLLIAGEGELRPDIEKSIREKKLDSYVIMLGNRNDIEDIYQAMDLFLLPSLFEGLGIVLIEAQCAGLPCVASADVIPNIVEITPCIARAGLDEPPENWAEKIFEKLEQHKDYARSDGYKYAAKSQFNITKEAPRLEKIINAD